MRRNVAIGILGLSLDSGSKDTRWEKWRPTVALCRQPGLHIDRLELITDRHADGLFSRVAADIEEVSPATEVVRHIVSIQNHWDFSEVYQALRGFAEGYPFDPDRERYLLNITTGTHVAQICWYMLTETKFIPAELIQMSPPKKAEAASRGMVGTHAIIDLDLSRYDEIARRFEATRQTATSFLKAGIETRNRAFNATIDEIEKVAIRSRAPVLLTGPTGAGKSSLARRIFELKGSQRQVTGAFVEVNCATLRGDQAMSTLFGHVKGAFTGAVGARPGLLKSADKGMVFLDEIGELGLDEQAMCLRAIEEKRFLPVGADKDVESDFQLIAGTNRDLHAAVREGRFREDLLARLNLWTFDLPPLRERREDIEPNLDYELARFSRREGRKATFNKEAREAFLSFAGSSDATWDANFRDLAASVTRMATLAPSGRIDPDTVDGEILRLRRTWGSVSRDADGDARLRALLGAAVDEVDPFDLPQLKAVIDTCAGSRSMSEASRKLFSVSRTRKTTSNDSDRLRKYLLRFGLTFDAIAATKG